MRTFLYQWINQTNFSQNLTIFFSATPPGDENPPKLSSDLITLWQGIGKNNFILAASI